jgi:aromatic-L-amino-acid/L-tryptophan decarboxylase
VPAGPVAAPSSPWRPAGPPGQRVYTGVVNEPLTTLDDAQLHGLGDMSPATFRASAHVLVDVLADYLANVERYDVLPAVEPGALRASLPAVPPVGPEPLAHLIADVGRVVLPNATHWQHPGFLAYFSTTASAPGILGEFATAVLGQNPMLWRTSPVGTELEEVVVSWLRQALGLPDTFDGLLTDTASTSTLAALAAAREAAGLDASAAGLGGRPEIGQPVVYGSEEAHSSVERACMTLGIGRAGYRRIPTDDAFAMLPAELAAAIAADRAAGRRPIAIVATVGTTSSTAVDPVPAIADIAEREGLWLHVDGAYGGSMAIVPWRRGPFAGWERADSIVVNPHKWLFTPLDASLLLSRRLDQFRAAFSLQPEYLRTLDRDRPVHDFQEYQPQLGRRMRALKLWWILRYFGLEGLQRRVDAHCRLAGELAALVDAAPDWERLAPVPFATVCLRWRPAALAGRENEPDIAARLDAANERLMAAVNATGEVFLSHTRLRGRFTIRVAIGNVRTEVRHVARAWELLEEHAADLRA